eukprot:c21473_g1_i4.p1 GENE.c21473_g1_i4~~c21473_g1_i4.p1  ORF type:complete len:449 (-),score=110.61 c21473_g1_i4:11-1357(-)
MHSKKMTNTLTFFFLVEHLKQQGLERTENLSKEQSSEIKSSQNQILPQQEQSQNLNTKPKPALQTLSNTLEIINSACENKIQLSELLEEVEFVVEKATHSIQIDFENSKMNFQEKIETIEQTEKKIEEHTEKIEKLKKEVNELELHVYEMQTKKHVFVKELEKLKQEHDELKESLNEKDEIIGKIAQISNSNKLYLEQWKMKLSEAKFELWGPEDLHTLLESIKLENWTKELISQGISIEHLSQAPLSLLMQIKQNNIQMTFGEAKYISLVIEEIKQKRGIPQMINDLDLKESNVRTWTIKNVESYFESKNLFIIAKALAETKVNGLVLINLQEAELFYLGVKNIGELITFQNILKNLQKNEKSTTIPLTPSPPKTLICAISNKVMKDPVLAQDESTYERSAIETWFLTNQTSPITGEIIEKILIPNRAIRELCNQWFQEHPDYNETN